MVPLKAILSYHVRFAAFFFFPLPKIILLYTMYVCIKIILLSFFFSILYLRYIISPVKMLYIFINTNVMWVIRKMNYYYNANDILHNSTIWDSLIEMIVICTMYKISYEVVTYFWLSSFILFSISTLRILESMLKKLLTKYSLYRWSNLRKVN